MEPRHKKGGGDHGCQRSQRRPACCRRAAAAPTTDMSAQRQSQIRELPQVPTTVCVNIARTNGTQKRIVIAYDYFPLAIFDDLCVLA